MDQPIFILQVNENKHYNKTKSEPLDPDDIDTDDIVKIEESDMESDILKDEDACLENYESPEDSLSENFDLINGNVIMNCDNVIDQNELVLDQTEEVVTCLTDNDQPDLSGYDENIIMQHMDIRQPLSTLKSLLQQRINSVNLIDYEFWLQDAQMLESHKNLVDQCVQGEGLVQINVQILTHEKKINIVDVLKPAEEYFEMSENSNESSSSEFSNNQDPQQNVVRWAIDPYFKKEQERLKFPTDPREWSNVHVRHWLQWAVRQFNLVGLKLSEWNMTGKELCDMTLPNFQLKVPSDPGDFFWTHLELLRKCNIVATVQKQEPKNVGKPETLSSPKAFKGKSTRSPTNNFILDLPVMHSNSMSSGNRIGNNGQIQLWQFLLELLTDKDHRKIIQWQGSEGEFKLINPEMVAQLWGERKNKPTMNYEKLSRALRYYYDGDMIAKVHGKRFVYKFVCDLKQLLGYSASELNKLVEESARRALQEQGW